MQGKTHDVIDHYLQEVLPAALDGESLGDRVDRTGTGRVRLTGFQMRDANHKPVVALRSGMDSVIALSFECSGDQPVGNVDIGLSVHNSYDQSLFVIYRSYRGELFDQLPGQGEFHCAIANLPLYPGRYRIQVRITANGDEADFLRGGVGHIEVEPGDFYGSGSSGFDGNTAVMVEGDWELAEVKQGAVHAHS